MRLLKTDIRAPFELLSAGQFHSSTPWTHARREIDSYEIIVGVQGTLYIQQGRDRYEVHPGDALLLLPGVPHFGYRACEGGLSFYWLHCLAHGATHIVNVDEWRHERRLRKSNEYLSSVSHWLYLPLFFRISSADRVDILFHQLQHLANSRMSYPEALHYAATSFLIELAEQAASDNDEHAYDAPDPLICAVVEWIRVHAAEPLTVSHIADHFGYNRDYLTRLFKRTMGMNLQEYVHRQKLAKAKALLSGSNRTVKQIAYEIGFADEKYFFRLFRKYEHLTPTGYRNAYYRKHLNKN